MNNETHTMSAYANLLSPLNIGPVRARNRIVCSPHGTSLGEDNLVSESNIAYYREKALGGAAIVITESMRVHPTAVPYSGAMALYDPRNIDLLKKISEVIHAGGALAYVQMNHAGRNMKAGHNGYPLWSPSPLASPLHGEIPHEMDHGDIRDVVASFADCARRVEAAGFDGAEVHGAHGYLMQQFLSPWCNQRTDEYGGSFDNRYRFMREVLEAVRAAVSHRFAIGIKISAEEWIEGGVHLDEMKEVARRIAAAGLVDHIHVSTSTYHPESYPNQIPDMHLPMAPFVHHAAAIREVVKGYPVAIFAVGRIHDPKIAEKVIAEGQADMVAMARQLIADPEWPKKVAEDRVDEIRSCIACNQGCIGRVAQQQTIRCVVNPVAGREKEWGSWKFTPASAARNVLIVGAGPAGLEAARVAALRGHRVTVFEKQTRVGGQLNDAVLAPGRTEFGKLVDFLSKEVHRLGVTVKLGTAATAQELLALAPDAVILATGATPAAATARGSLATLNAVDALKMLSSGELRPPLKAVVIDEVGQYQTYGVVEALATAGTRVDLVTAKPAIGWHIPTVSLLTLMQRLKAAGVQIHTSSSVGPVEDGTVKIRSSLRTTETVLKEVDLVVHAQLPIPDTTLSRELRERLVDIQVIGDCASARSVLEATSEGHRAGRAV
jgi:mycofactocin system FadH/OYE family oxidoreductase 2